MRISIEPDLIQAAIKLYAERGGAHGIHTWEVAEQVGCTDPSLYRIFKKKENLFYKAVATVTAAVLKEFLYELLAEGAESKNIKSALLKWYRSLARDSARMLYFAAFFAAPSHRQAATAIDQMVSTLAKRLRDEEHMSGKKATGVSRGLIHCLIHLKATEFPSADMRLPLIMIEQWFK